MISPFDEIVFKAAAMIGAPSGFTLQQFIALINAVMKKESTFNPNAVSYTGKGLGLMQVNPDVWLSVFNVSRDSLFDPKTNIEIGGQILKDYLNQFGLKGGLGAYFAGPSARLTQSAVNYANTVLSYYNNFIVAVKQIFNRQPADIWWFTGQPTTFTDLLADLPSLPDYTTIADLTTPLAPPSPIYQTIEPQTDYLPYVIGGLILLIIADQL